MSALLHHVSADTDEVSVRGDDLSGQTVADTLSGDAYAVSG